MNKILIALVVILIGIQSWTLKTQQQILKEVMPEVKLDTTIGIEYCSYLKEQGIGYLKGANTMFKLGIKKIREGNIDGWEGDTKVEILQIKDAEKFANIYQAFCKD